MYVFSSKIAVVVVVIVWYLYSAVQQSGTLNSSSWLSNISNIFAKMLPEKPINLKNNTSSPVSVSYRAKKHTQATGSSDFYWQGRTFIIQHNVTSYDYIILFKYESVIDEA